MSADYTNDQQQALRQALFSAALPCIVESVLFLTDGVKVMREELERDRLCRADCAPLERRLKVRDLEAQIEDLDLERKEKNAAREERKEEREAAKEEREIRLKGLRAEVRKNAERRIRSEAERHVNGHDSEIFDTGA